MTEAAPYDARAVANFLLDLASDRGVSLTQMQILKILYFSQGWYLALYDRPLILHDFEAWQYGPVIKVVRDAFRSYGSAPIRSRAEKIILQTGEFQIVPPTLSQADRDFVGRVFEAYHVFDAWMLSGMTHEQGSPWDRLWNSETPIGRLALRIKNEEIRSHFIELRRRFPLS